MSHHSSWLSLFPAFSDDKVWNLSQAIRGGKSPFMNKIRANVVSQPLVLRQLDSETWRGIQTEWETPVRPISSSVFSSLRPFSFNLAPLFVFLRSFISWKNIAGIPAVIPLRFSISVGIQTGVCVCVRAHKERDAEHWRYWALPHTDSSPCYVCM